jgi:hypothetical protein
MVPKESGARICMQKSLRCMVVLEVEERRQSSFSLQVTVIMDIMAVAEAVEAFNTLMKPRFFLYLILDSHLHCKLPPLES